MHVSRMRQTPLPPTATQREADEAPIHGGPAAERGRIERKLKSAGAERYLLDFKVRHVSLCLSVCQSVSQDGT